MSNLFLTLIIAFVVIVLALAAMAIGWLITGRTKLEKACGRDPTKKKSADCGIDHPCDLCDLPSQKKSDVSHDDVQ